MPLSAKDLRNVCITANIFVIICINTHITSTHKGIHEKQFLNKILKLLTIVLNKVVIAVLLSSWYLSSILAKEANDPGPQFPGMLQMQPTSFHSNTGGNFRI